VPLLPAQWTVENVSKNREPKVFSERFEIGTYFW
jgi:hypothetical protein